MKTLLFVLSFTVLFPGFSIGQKQADSLNINTKEEIDCPQQALGDLFRKKGKPPRPLKSFNALVLPNISSNPSNGVLLGIGGALSWYLGPRNTTKVSSAGFTVAYTTKNQMISFIKPNVYLKDNKYFFQGDFRYYIYSQSTYGLGTNAPSSGGVPSSIHWSGEGGPDDSVSFPMKFNYIKIHGTISRLIRENLYTGVGYHLDRYYTIHDLKLDLDASTPLQTPHFYYSDHHNFDTTDYTLSGLSLNFVYDSRDNLINAYKGIYANINYRYNFQGLGSDQNSSGLWLEFRSYHGLSKKMDRHVLGFWVFGNFNLTGSMPYLTLPALGEDQRARSGRGYTNGRYRGRNLAYAEAEWRFPISQCSKILGGVIFLNATTTDNPDRNIALFQYIQPGFGVGLRVMVNKHFRTNINLDFAIGTNTKGFYFSGQETF